MTIVLNSTIKLFFCEFTYYYCPEFFIPWLQFRFERCPVVILGCSWPLRTAKSAFRTTFGTFHHESYCTYKLDIIFKLKAGRFEGIHSLTIQSLVGRPKSYYDSRDDRRRNRRPHPLLRRGDDADALLEASSAVSRRKDRRDDRRRVEDRPAMEAAPTLV